MRSALCGQLFLLSILPSLMALASSTSAAHAVRDDTGGGLVQEVGTLPGIVEPKQQVTLEAPLDGVLMTVEVQEGTLVREGELLALMDNRIAQAAVRSAQVAAERQAAMERANNDLEMAERYLQRVTEAAEAASEVELDRARGSVEQAKIALSDAQEQVRVAKSHLDLERARLATHELRAPFDGRILDVEGSKGQSLTRSEPILTLANLKTLRVELYVPLAWYGKLELGQSCTLRADEPVGRDLNAVLVATQPVIDSGTRTFRCTFEIDNTTEQWPAGFIVRLVQPSEVGISTAETNTESLRSTWRRADHPVAARGRR